MAMLEVKNLEVYYGVIQAIKGISFVLLYQKKSGNARKGNKIIFHFCNKISL